MKRINPLFTAINPDPIPGCHTSEGCCAQCCGPLGLALSLTRVCEWPVLLYLGCPIINQLASNAEYYILDI